MADFKDLMRLLIFKAMDFMAQHCSWVEDADLSASLWLFVLCRSTPSGMTVFMEVLISFIT